MISRGEGGSQEEEIRIKGERVGLRKHYRENNKQQQLMKVLGIIGVLGNDELLAEMLVRSLPAWVKVQVEPIRNHTLTMINTIHYETTTVEFTESRIAD